MLTVYAFFWYFLIYATLGWMIECGYHTMAHGEIVNRGYLNGPTCPIYGFGMVVVIAAMTPINELDAPFIVRALLLYLGGMVFCSCIEFIGGWALDMIFHMRWWDYRDKKFNILGYVCLQYSLMWGLAVCADMLLVHPLIVRAIRFVPKKIGLTAMIILYIIYAVDVLVSTQKAIGMSRSIRELEAVAKKLHDIGDTISNMVGETVVESGRMADEAKEKLEDVTDETRDRLETMAIETMVKIDDAKDALTDANAQRKAEMEENREELERSVRILVNRIHAYHAFKAFPDIKRSERLVELREHLSEVMKK